MQLELYDVGYGWLIQRLGDLNVYGASGHWFTSLEEAHEAALKGHHSSLRSYARDCPGRRKAAASIAILEGSPQAR